MSKKGQDKLKTEVGWQVKKVPSTASVLQRIFLRLWYMQISTSDNRKKNHYRLEQKQIFN